MSKPIEPYLMSVLSSRLYSIGLEMTNTLMRTARSQLMSVCHDLSTAICDRNGKVLVTNSYTYDMQIEFGALPEDRDSVHRSLLGALDAIEFCGATRAGGYSVFEGDYPELSYTDEALDPSTKAHAKLLSVLKSAV